MVNRTISQSKADGKPNKNIAENVKCLLHQLGDLSLDPCLPEEKENRTGYNGGLEVYDEPSCLPRTTAADTYSPSSRGAGTRTIPEACWSVSLGKKCKVLASLRPCVKALSCSMIEQAT